MASFLPELHVAPFRNETVAKVTVWKQSNKSGKWESAVDRLIGVLWTFVFSIAE